MNYNAKHCSGCVTTVSQLCAAAKVHQRKHDYQLLLLQRRSTHEASAEL